MSNHQNTDPGGTARVAVITGADSGIGRAVAVRLAADGMDIGITWNSDHEDAERTAAEVRELGRRAAVEQMDLTGLPEAADAVDRLADRLGRLDVLVNNAGTGTATPFLDIDVATVRRVLEVDLVGPFLCGQRAARQHDPPGRRRPYRQRDQRARAPAARRRRALLRGEGRTRPPHPGDGS